MRCLLPPRRPPLVRRRRGGDAAPISERDRLAELIGVWEARVRQHAADLHDGVLQHLYAVRLGWAHASAAAGVPTLDARLGRIADAVQRAVVSLAPPALASHGLTEALTSLAEGGRFTLRVAGPSVPPGWTATFLYRIVQEVLAATPPRACPAVRLRVHGEHVVLSIGCPGATFGRLAGPGLFGRLAGPGLFGRLTVARAYAEALGGTLRVAAGGTALVLRVALSALPSLLYA